MMTLTSGMWHPLALHGLEKDGPHAAVARERRVAPQPRPAQRRHVLEAAGLVRLERPRHIDRRQLAPHLLCREQPQPPADGHVVARQHVPRRGTAERTGVQPPGIERLWNMLRWKQQ